MSPPVLALLCDAGARTGLGHWVRSSTVAGELAARGWQVTAVHAPDVEPRVLEETAARGWKHTVQERNAEGLDQELDRIEPHAMLIDTYRVDAALVAGLRRPGRITVLIDDLNDRGPLDADLVVNQNLGADEYGYRIAPGTRLLLGPTYAMLRPQFADLRPEGLRLLDQQPATPETVFVLMGGSDATGTLAPVLEGCAAAFPGARIRAVVPTGSTGAVDHLVGDGRVTAIPPTPTVAREMVDADLIVSAGGTSVWELCALARPFGIVVVAENQQDATRRLVRAGAAVRLAERPVAPDRLAAALVDSTAEPGALVARARRAAELVDGQGCRRVADAVEAASRTTQAAVAEASDNGGKT